MFMSGWPSENRQISTVSSQGRLHTVVLFHDGGLYTRETGYASRNIVQNYLAFWLIKYRFINLGDIPITREQILFIRGMYRWRRWNAVEG